MNNYNELHQHKRSDTIKWIVVFVLIAVLIAGTVASLAIGLKDGSTQENAPETPIENVATNDFDVELENTQFVRLAMSSPMLYSASGTASQTLSATVLPSTAVNKAVDWSVEWGDASNTSTVTEYITVTPDADGSTTATVTCYKAFSGTILVTATTRESGYSASCIITFVGKPTDIAISGSVTPSSGAYKLGIGQTYTFDVALSNPFNSVGSQFNSISASVSGVGSVILGYMEHYNQSGNDKWYDASDKTVTLDSLKANFITVSYSQGKLTVNTLRSIESYYASYERLDSGRTRGYTDKFRSYVDDCYFKVTLTENTSGFAQDFTFRFDTGVVTGVNVNSTEMSF